jgi:hypothetical protein
MKWCTDLVNVLRLNEVAHWSSYALLFCLRKGKVGLFDVMILIDWIMQLVMVWR